MKLFKKIKESTNYFEQDTLDYKFDEMMAWIKDLSRKDYNRLKKAMDLDYNAYQTLHGIEPDDDTSVENAEYILEKEDK